MNTKQNCNPTICYDTLMADDGEFMTVDVVKKKCMDCTKIDTCFKILKLLSEDNEEEAKLLMPKTK